MRDRGSSIERRILIKSSLSVSLLTILAGSGSSDRYNLALDTTHIENKANIIESLDYSRSDLTRVVDSYLLDVRSRRDDLRIIGSWYLAKFTSESEQQNIVENVNETISKLSLEDSKREIQRQILDEVENDFEEERLTVTEGWWFSTTEVRICSLLFLME